MNETKTKYEKAVELVVNFSVEESFQMKANNTIGDESAFGFVLMNLVSLESRKKVTSEQIEKFKQKLTELLINVNINSGNSKNMFGTYFVETYLDVDYGPNEKLSKACEFAEISKSCLPLKTTSKISLDKDGSFVIFARVGYGSEWRKLG